MNLDDTKVRLLDNIFDVTGADPPRAVEHTAAVTLAYTHSLHRFWRTVLRMLPVPPKSSVLDVGSGLGILAFELAAHLPVDVQGVDINPGFVEHAKTLSERLAVAGLFAEGATVRFSVGDVCALDLADESLDLVFVREVFQFLPDPAQAVGELFRVLRPGRHVCISDMDDQLRITWPPASPAFERLVTAVAELQNNHGGDRHVGRKLTSYLRAGEFEINSVVVLPEAQHRVVDAGETERSLIVEQLHAARPRVVAEGVMDAERFDADLATLEQEAPFEEFRMSSRIVVLGRRPN
jgi:ubiquinone/menaquinone biosynthesis C-methylase UbiE